jgi:hypothetical protein
VRVKMIPFTLALLAAALTTIVFAPAASAHEGSITINCNLVTFSYIRFPAGTNTIPSETIAIDGSTPTSKSFTFTGPTGSDAIPISLSAGSHTVTATANWGRKLKPKSVTLTQTLVCGGTG